MEDAHETSNDAEATTTMKLLSYEAAYIMKQYWQANNN